MNKQNEILKHKFLIFLENAEKYSSLSIEKIEKAIHHYQICHNSEDFGKYNLNKAIAYKKYLEQKSYAQSSYRTYLHHIKLFFTWLSKQDGFKRKIKVDDVEYFNPPRAIASQPVLVPFPTHNEILKIFNSLPSITEVDLRNRALIAFTYCTGMRDKAISTLPYSAVDIGNLHVVQDPRKGVKVKFSKIIYSKIFKYDEKLILTLCDWYKLLQSKQFQPHEPFFPKSKQLQMEDGFSYIESTEIDRIGWRSTVSIRKIFKEAAVRAGISYFPPHSFRHSAISKAIECVKNFKEFKAISQNFGHEDVKTILESYANSTPDKLLNILDGIDVNRPEKMSKKPQDALLKKMNKSFINLINEYNNS